MASHAKKYLDLLRHFFAPLIVLALIWTGTFLHDMPGMHIALAHVTAITQSQQQMANPDSCPFSDVSHCHQPIGAFHISLEKILPQIVLLVAALFTWLFTLWRGELSLSHLLRLIPIARSVPLFIQFRTLLI